MQEIDEPDEEEDDESKGGDTLRTTTRVKIYIKAQKGRINVKKGDGGCRKIWLDARQSARHVIEKV